MRSRVIVTGGCGFIGKSVAIELIKRGHEVVVVDVKDKCNMENDSYEYE